MDAPKAKTTYMIRQSGFTGIDLSTSASNVSQYRSPNCVNMIRDSIGTNRKRYGYKTIGTFTGKINGIHQLKTPTIDDVFIHEGTGICFMDQDTGWVSDLTHEGVLADDYSYSTQMGSRLFVQDGHFMRYFDGEYHDTGYFVDVEQKEYSKSATIPTVVISRLPSGGGTSYQPINLMTRWRKDSFLGDSTSLTYQLSATELDGDIDTSVKVEELQSDGTYKTLVEGTDFTVSTPTGIIYMVKAHPTPIDGHDNIIVTYAKTNGDYSSRINTCRFSTLYGMNGESNIMFLSGNPSLPNYDWHCMRNDPTYWPDTYYNVVGQDNSPIIGYSIVNGYLVTFKEDAKNTTSVTLRSIVYDSTTSSLQVKSEGTYEAEGALSRFSFQTIQNEPMYLTSKKNISAITPTDITGERVSQERSFYISNALKEESLNDLKNAYSCIYKDFYLLAVGSKVYLLDTAQYSYEENAPYSTRQYEAYLWTDINARVIYSFNDRLIFGTSDGKVKWFFNTDVGGYTDDGVITEKTITIDGQEVTTKESFPCYWETAELYSSSSTSVDHRELKKTFKHLAVALKSYVHTGCRVWANIDGIWEVIFDYDGSASYLDFNDIDFTDFTFRTDGTPTIIGGKFKGKKLLHIQFRFENSKPQPFAILWAKTKYTVGNEYRK